MNASPRLGSRGRTYFKSIQTSQTSSWQVLGCRGHGHAWGITSDENGAENTPVWLQTTPVVEIGLRVLWVEVCWLGRLRVISYETDENSSFFHLAQPQLRNVQRVPQHSLPTLPMSQAASACPLNPP